MQDFLLDPDKEESVKPDQLVTRSIKMKEERRKKETEYQKQNSCQEEEEEARMTLVMCLQNKEWSKPVFKKMNES
jgi:protein tyrosine/serine phosphatase